MSSEDDPSENVPMTESKEDGTQSGGKGEVPFSKTKLIALGAVIVVLVILVIVLAMVLGITIAKIQKDKRKDQEANVTTKPTVLSSPVPTTPGTEAWWRVRMPNDVIPMHYNVLLNITVDQPRFDGSVDIFVNVTRPTNLILVHSWEHMNVTSAVVQNSAGGGNLPIKNQFWFKKNEFQVIEMESNLEPGLLLIKLKFEALFSLRLIGLYRSSYKRPDGSLSYFAATQFEPGRARRAFPCFDEPAFKATFNVTIAHRPDYVALSNMPIFKSEIINGQKHDHYMKTVVMPTYLLAFVVGDFVYKVSTSKNNVTMRYYSRPSFVNHTDYALSVGGKILTFFEEYLGVRYSLTKEDQAAIPEFDAGAMENWGLILYRENFLLWDPKTATENNKLTVVSVITHEIAHQWFGNIVTLKWWNDIWLNEGFAKFFEYIAKTAGEPAWKMEDDIISSVMGDAMSFDAGVNSNPIRVEHHIGLNRMSPVIYYDKGACLLRMLQAFLGNNTFLGGLKLYLARHAFGNVESVDLWKALTDETCARGRCVDVKHVMDTWILQMGFPVVNIKRKNATHLTVSQKRFLFDEKANVSNSKYISPFKYKWVIPFTYVTSNQPTRQLHMMDGNDGTIKWNGTGWIKGNHDYKGFYIVNYEDDNWDALAAQLKFHHTKFSSSDRAGLIMDAFNLARGRQLNYTKAFAITGYLNTETKYVPWKVMMEQVGFFVNKLSRTSPTYNKLQKFLVHQAKAQYQKLGFHDTGNGVEKLNRGQFLSIYCRADVQSCIENATARFMNWMRDPTANPVPPNFRSLVYHVGVANGGADEWDFVFDQYKKTEDSITQDKLLYGMAGSREPWILGRYLSYTLDPTKINEHHIKSVLHYVTQYNPLGSRMAWDFVRINWANLTRRFGSPSKAYKSLIGTLISHLARPFELKELMLFNDNLTPADGVSSESKSDATKTIIANIQWLKRNEKDIDSWLTSFIHDNNIQ